MPKAGPVGRQVGAQRAPRLLVYVYLYSDLESTWGRYVTESEPSKASWISTEASSGFCISSTFLKQTRRRINLNLEH